MIKRTEELEVTEGDQKGRSFVTALSRGLNVLHAFSANSSALCNKDIARITGLPKSSVTRITYTLTQVGYLRYSPQLGEYQLSSEVLTLGYDYVLNLKVRQVAKPYIEVDPKIWTGA